MYLILNCLILLKLLLFVKVFHKFSLKISNKKMNKNVYLYLCYLNIISILFKNHMKNRIKISKNTTYLKQNIFSSFFFLNTISHHFRCIILLFIIISITNRSNKYRNKIQCYTNIFFSLQKHKFNLKLYSLKFIIPDDHLFLINN